MSGRGRCTSRGGNTYRRKDQIRIFHHFRKQETFLHVPLLSSICHTHVTNLAEPTLRPGRCINGHERIPSPILVHGIVRDTISIVIALEDLRPQVINRVRDVKARSVVESSLICRKIGRVPGKFFRPNARSVGGVGIVAAVGESKAEIDVILSTEDLPTEKKVSAGEAGQMFGYEVGIWAVKGSEEG